MFLLAGKSELPNKPFTGVKGPFLYLASAPMGAALYWRLSGVKDIVLKMNILTFINN